MLIRQQLVTTTNRIYEGINPALGITFHETANFKVGASAAMHANLQSRVGTKNSSWHWQVDDKEAVQSFLHSQRCWHAGDVRAPRGGNLNYVAIELCVNTDGDYMQAIRNATELVQHIRSETPSAQALVQHNHWTGKNCPLLLRGGLSGIDWPGFVALVSGVTVPVDNPVTPPVPKPILVPVEGVNVSALPILNLGDKGIAVKRLQGLLIANGYSVGKAGIDGDWGRSTEGGFTLFQKANPDTGTGGKPDHSCGPASWSRLLGL